MAINYQPADAMDERVYQAYGAAQARAADRDFALKAGAQAQQAANASSQLAQNDEHFIAQQRQQAALEGNREANQANLAFAQMDHQSAMQQQRQNFEFTQADNLRLQRLNQDAAGWDALRQSGEIDDREHQRGIQMLNQGRMPLQARRDAAEERNRERQNRRLDDESARAATRFNRESAFHARSLAERQQVLLDPDVEAEVRSNLDPDGSIGNMDVPGFDEAVRAEVIRRGGGTRYVETAPGTMTPMEPRRAAEQEARRQHIAQGIQRVDTELRQDLSDFRKPENVANAPEWTKTTAGIEEERTRRIDRVQSDVERIYNPQAPRQTTTQRRQGLGAQIATPQTGQNVATTSSGTAIPTGPAPRAPLSQINELSDVAAPRIRTVETIANSLVPRSVNPNSGLPDGPLATRDQFNLGLQMRNILNRASREGRTLRNDEVSNYADIQARLAQSNPDAAALFSLTNTPEQNAFGHSESRVEDLKKLVPELATEATRLAQTRTPYGGDNQAGEYASQLLRVLEPAARRNRRLSPEETNRYLQIWGRLNRVDEAWARRLSLHQARE